LGGSGDQLSRAVGALTVTRNDDQDVAGRPAPPRILPPLPGGPGVERVHLVAHRLTADVHHSLFIPLERHLLTNPRRFPARDAPPIG
jgi:hypothetical protein